MSLVDKFLPELLALMGAVWAVIGIGMILSPESSAIGLIILIPGMAIVFVAGLTRATVGYGGTA